MVGITTSLCLVVMAMVVGWTGGQVGGGGKRRAASWSWDSHLGCFALLVLMLPLSLALIKISPPPGAALSAAENDQVRLYIDVERDREADCRYAGGLLQHTLFNSPPLPLFLLSLFAKRSQLYRKKSKEEAK